jgi:hypothetical protein
MIPQFIKTCLGFLLLWTNTFHSENLAVGDVFAAMSWMTNL